MQRKGTSTYGLRCTIASHIATILQFARNGANTATALHALSEELKAAGHFPEEQDEQLGDFVSRLHDPQRKAGAALWTALRAATIFPKPAMVIAWLKRVLEVLNNDHRCR